TMATPGGRFAAGLPPSFAAAVAAGLCTFFRFGKPLKVHIAMTQPTPAPATDDDKKRMRERVEKLLAQNPHTSEGTIELGGRTMTYTATAAFVPVAAGGLDDKRGDPNAAVFTIAYQMKGIDPRTRPVCFAFNGGPGAASVFLNLGAL